MMMIMIVFSVVLWPTIHGIVTINSTNILKIGGLFNVCGSNYCAGRYSECGEIQELHGIQKIESALLALDQINKDPNILRGVTLGLEVYDTCSSELQALDQILCHVRGRTVFTLEDPVKQKKKPKMPELHNSIQSYDSIIEKPFVVGIIGPATTEQSVAVQNLLKLFNVPQIGFTDTMEELGNLIEYPTFLRVAPCDSIQSKVIRDILLTYNWKYVATVHSKGAYGEHIYKSFRNLLEQEKHYGVCIDVGREVDHRMTASEIDAIMLDLNNYKSVNVIICFCENQMLRTVFMAMKRLKLASRFTIIASDGWDDVERLTYDVEEQAWGTIFVQIHTPKVPEFKDYYTSLKPATNTRNPWFRKFWEQKFDCSLQLDPIDHISLPDTDQPCLEKPVVRKLCTGNESLAENYVEHRKIYFVMSATIAMAQGLHSMIIEKCGANYTGLCEKMLRYDASKLVTHLVDISYNFNNFTSLEHGKPPSRFDILNFQKLPNGTFKWIQFANWNNDILKLDRKYQSRENRNITSICSNSCPPGYYKSIQNIIRNQHCCWQCERCPANEYVDEEFGICAVCLLGWRPNPTQTGCEIAPPPPIFQWRQPMMIMIPISTVIGLIATLIVLSIFLKYRNTPMVQSSNPRFCYLMFLSMILSYISVFAIIIRPSIFSCTVARFLPGVALTMMYAVLFTELYRIAKISVSPLSEVFHHVPRLNSMSFQFAVIFVCVGIEVVISLTMIVVVPRVPVIATGIHDEPIETCSNSASDVLPPLIMIIILFFLCIAYTYITRHIPGTFNEAETLGFAMILSFITWVVFLTLHFTTRFKAMTMSMCLTLFPFFILAFHFFPKIYIIIFKPKENNIGLFATSRSMKRRWKRESRVSNVAAINMVSMSTVCGSTLSPSGNYCKRRRSVAIQTSGNSLHE